MSDFDKAIAHARYLGADAAIAAATWVEMSESDAKSILSDIDPEVMDRYEPPNLSGEWADDPTSDSLFREVWGEPYSEDIEDGAVDAVSDAWEEGRDTVWNDALHAVALRTLGRIDEAMRVERANESFMDTLRSAQR